MRAQHGSPLSEPLFSAAVFRGQAERDEVLSSQSAEDEAARQAAEAQAAQVGTSLDAVGEKHSKRGQEPQ